MYGVNLGKSPPFYVVFLGEKWPEMHILQLEIDGMGCENI
jgi:hypothetical protein